MKNLDVSSLQLDYSNSTKSDLKDFLQSTLNMLFPLKLYIVNLGVLNAVYNLMEFISSGSYETSGSYLITRAVDGGYRTFVKVDLTNYTKITFTGKCNTVDDNHTIYCGVADINTHQTFVLNREYSTSENTYTIDVSSLKGEYYVGLNNYMTVSYTKYLIIE